jgi:hypothetical protein
MTRLTKLVFVFVCAALFSLTVVFAQKSNAVKNKLSQTDSLLLDSTWKIFVNAIETKQTDKIKLLSFNQIECECYECFKWNKPSPTSKSIPIDTFIKYAYQNFPTSEKWSAVKTRKYVVILSEYWQWKSLRLDKSSIIFELAFPTIYPGEYERGNEGEQYLFAFIKVHNKFKFRALSSVP